MQKPVFGLPSEELPCLDHHKSFYGKAKIIPANNGKYLKSYDTIVCFLSNRGTFTKLWNGYSDTTMRHVNSFMKYCSWNYGGKKWWTSLVKGKEYNNKMIAEVK